MSILDDIKQLNAGTLIVLYELDLTDCIGKFGQTTQQVFRWCDGVNELGNNIVWQGQEYKRYPIQASGFDRQGDGTIPRPKLIVANIGGSVSTLTKTYNDITGAKLKRTRTFAKYLDSVNFAEGNIYANPDAFLDHETWVIDRKSNETSVSIEWELTAPYDIAGVKLPRRQAIQNICTWKYRSPECGYTGTAYFNAKDQSVASAGADRCGKRLSSCKCRFGENAILPYGGFPALGLY